MMFLCLLKMKQCKTVFSSFLHSWRSSFACCRSFWLAMLVLKSWATCCGPMDSLCWCLCKQKTSMSGCWQSRWGRLSASFWFHFVSVSSKILGYAINQESFLDVVSLLCSDPKELIFCFYFCDKALLQEYPSSIKCILDSMNYKSNSCLKVAHGSTYNVHNLCK